LQEVTSLISNLGAGISQSIGTGGRDIKAAVGGITMLQGLQALINDRETEVIVLVAKPPDPEVAHKVLEAASTSGKPVVINFIGGDLEQIKKAGCEPAGTLKEAAYKAVNLSRKQNAALEIEDFHPGKEAVDREKKSYKEGQRYLRALYSGGTLAYESLVMLQNRIEPIYTNLSSDYAKNIEDVYKSREHTIMDFGEDEFTQGRLHPMIDPALRNNRIIAEAKDPETAVIIIDLVLGYNAHPDPAGSALDAIKEARNTAGREGRHITFAAAVCGTDRDNQNRKEQMQKLEKEGILVFPSNADMAAVVAELLE